MWILFRLVLAVIGFFVQRRARTPELVPSHTFEGVPYWQSIKRKKGEITHFTLGMPRRSPTWLSLHREGAWDRWFKRVGFSEELQTLDARFDDLVYVTSDHPFIGKTLAQSAELRRAICDVLERGYDISFDGTSVAIDRESETEPTPEDLANLLPLHAASEVLESGVPSRFSDPFLWKALVVEAFIFSVFCYAVGAFINAFFEKVDLHVSGSDVALTGLVVAFALFVVLLSTIGFVMRGSSRGHRIIVEGATALLLGLPGAAIQLVSDSNRALDFSPPERVSAVVRGCSSHSSRKGGTTYHLTFQIESTDSPSTTIKVTKALCSAAREGERAELSIGPGRWSLPWYRQIKLKDESWEASL